MWICGAASREDDGAAYGGKEAYAEDVAADMSVCVSANADGASKFGRGCVGGTLVRRGGGEERGNELIRGVLYREENEMEERGRCC